MKKMVLFLLMILSTNCFAQKRQVCEISFVNGKADEYYVFDVSEKQVWATLYKVYLRSYNPYSFREIYNKSEIALIKCGNVIYWDLAGEREKLKTLKDKLGAENYNYLTYLDKKRSPASAGLFSLLLPGGGQFYNNQPGKGALMLLGQIGVGIFVAKGDIPWYALIPIPVISLVDATVSASNINVELRQKYGVPFSYRKSITYFTFSKTF